MSGAAAHVAIVDFGLGNLFSVRQACARAGMVAVVTSDRAEILDADLVILPGVGAFGDAMDNLERLDLVSPLRDYAASGRLLVGICLGMQLLMTESSEFGSRRGLDLVPGVVRRLAPGATGHKVPHVGWSRVEAAPGGARVWAESPLAPLAPGAYQYFVHSYHARPDDGGAVLAVTRYGEEVFCSALAAGNLFACQFHPERSGEAGLAIYRRLAEAIGQPEESAWISR